MSKSLHLIAAAAALAALGGAPPAGAAPLSEWLSATVTSSVQQFAATDSSDSQFVFDSIFKQSLLPDQTVTLADSRSVDTTAANGTHLLGQQDWNLATSLQVANGTVGFERATLGLDVVVSQQWLELAANGQPLPASLMMQAAGSEVTAEFRLDAVTDARMSGGSGSQDVSYLAVAAGLMIWNEALADWQALATPVPELTPGQSFEWASRLDPGLYQWMPYLSFNDTSAQDLGLAFDSSFYLTLELSEVAAPPPSDVPEPGSWALALAGLVALRGRDVQWRTGRRRSNTQ